MASLYDILANFNIIEVSVAMAIGIASKDTIYSFVDGLIMPLMIVFLGQGVFTGRDHVFKWHGTTFQVGLFISSLLRYFFLFLIIILLLQYVIGPISTKVIEVKNEAAKKGLCKMDQCLKLLNQLDDNIKEVKKEIEKDKSFDKVFLNGK